MKLAKMQTDTLKDSQSLLNNYSLNTIFERKKNLSKDFIKNNIKNVSKFSSKVSWDKGSNGSITARNNSSKCKVIRNNESNGNIRNLNSSRIQLISKAGKAISATNVSKCQRLNRISNWDTYQTKAQICLLTEISAKMKRTGYGSTQMTDQECNRIA